MMPYREFSLVVPQTALLTRRRLLKQLTASGCGFLASALGSGQPQQASTLKMDECDAKARLTIPYQGLHQAGIITPEQVNAAFISFHIIAKSKDELETFFKNLTRRIAHLTQGGPVATANSRFPPSESGILGTQIYPDSLTITVSVGASLFDKRYGLMSKKPHYLIEMPAFPNDALKQAWCDGDLLLQICANTQETVIYAVRDLIKNFTGQLVPSWKIDGFLPARDLQCGQTPINLFGFKDGTGNADSDDQALMDNLIWVGSESGEPAWALGGSYQVVRLIRFFVEFWDRTPLGEQQSDIGRTKACGAPLGLDNEYDDPEFQNDLDGERISFDSHIRRAEPRTPERHVAKLRRRSYSYSLGLTSASHLDMGLIFVAYQADLMLGFISTQSRLNGEPLEEYIKPFGGGYYFALLGIQPAGYLGQSLLES